MILDLGGSRRFLAAVAGTPRHCATSSAIMWSRTSQTEDAVLVIDETGFLKQGKASCGVARQYTGSAGKITNCQIGVFACVCVASRSCLHRSGACICPRAWTDDPARMTAAHVPDGVGFATKPALALR